MRIRPGRFLFETLLMTLLVTCRIFAEPPQINQVGGDGKLAVSQTPSTATTDFKISGHYVGETSRADLLPGETWNMRFADPSDSFLLRVLDPTGTRLLGTLNIFNGSFVLLNTHGLDFGSSSRVNVDHATFVASTLDIQNRDFVSGKYAFDASVGANNRAVSNHGLIQTTGPGSVVLLGQAVENTGTIEAPLSTVALASGDAVTLSLDANGLIAVDVKDPVTHKVFDTDGQQKKSQVSNTGTIHADGGQVLINAGALDTVFDSSVNLEGVIRANKAVQGADGTVRIVASDDIVNTGTLETRDGELHLTSDRRIQTLGHLFARILLEKGMSLKMGGVVQAGRAGFNNLDGAVLLVTGSFSGTIEDAGDIIVDNNAQITLTGPTAFWADSDPVTHAHDGNGVFTMNSGSAIIGGGNALTIYSADKNSGGVAAPSVIRDISGVNGLSLCRSPGAGASPAFTLAGTLAVLGGLDIVDVSLDAGGQDLDIDGDLVLGSGGSLSNAAEIFITGNWTNNGGTFTPGTGRVTFLSTLADQLINGTATGQTFYDVRVAKGSKILSVGGSTTSLSLNDLDLESGILAPGASLSKAAEIFITGNWTNNGGTFTPGTGRVTFLSTLADQLINGTAASQTFYDIRVAKGTRTLSVGGSTTTLSMHELDLESGIFAAGTALALNITGNVIFRSTALSAWNGLTIDADTFTVSDVANIIGGTVRTYYPVTDAILDAMISGNKVRTLVIGVPYDENGYGWLAHYWGGSVPAGTGRVNMVDNNYVAYLTHVKDRISAAGGNMSVIIEFGNEYNYHPDWFGGDINNWFSALTIAAARVHAAFGSAVLVSTASGDVPGEFVTTIGTGVDLVGVNTYRGLGSVSGLITDWNTACASAGRTVPLYLSETGFPSWSGDGGESQQNINVPLLWEEIFKNDIGVTFMSFEDNMRKGGSLSAQDSREDYWGWLNQDGTHKPVYDAMADVWALPEFHAGSADIHVGGDWINNGGTFTPATGTVTFNGNDQRVFEGGLFYNFVHAGTGTLQAAQDLNIDNAFTNTQGTFDANDHNITVGGLTTVSGGEYQSKSGMQVLNGGLTVSGGIFDGTTGFASVQINGDLALLTGGELTGGSEIDISGNWIDNGGTFTPGTGAVIFDGTDQTVSENGSFYDLGNTGSGTLLAGHDLTVAHAFTHATGIFDANDHNITVGGQTTVYGGEYQAKSGIQTFIGGLTLSGGTFTGATGAGRVSITGDMLLSAGAILVGGTAIEIAGNWTNNGGAFTPGASRVAFLGTLADQLINGTAAAQTFYDVRVAKSTRTLSMGGNTSTLAVHDLDLESGSLNANGHNINVNGDWINNGVAFTPGAGTVTFGAPDTGHVIRSGASAFANVIFNDGGMSGAWATIDPMNVTGNMTLSSGSVMLGGMLMVQGNLNILSASLNAAGNAIDLAGNWHNTGIFTHGNNTVTLTGEDQFLLGDNTFYNLLKTSTNGATLTVEAGSLQTINGTVTLKGGSGTRMHLRSDASGNQWQMNAAAVDMSWLDLKDSHNTGAVITLPHSRDSGNNTGYVIETDQPVLSGNTPWRDVTGSHVLTTFHPASFDTLLSAPFLGSLLIYNYEYNGTGLVNDELEAPAGEMPRAPQDVLPGGGLLPEQDVPVVTPGLLKR